MFGADTVHLSTNHSKGEYVSKEDPSNTINDLENQNKILKRTILCRKTPKLIHQYMALLYYRQQLLEKDYKDDLGSQIMQFLLDIKSVYPGIVDGQRQAELQEIDPSTVETEELEDLVPVKRPRRTTLEEDFDELSEGETSNVEYAPEDIF